VLFPTVPKLVGTAAYNALPSHISKTAADLLNRMLAIRPEERITAQEGLEHKWMLFADFA
jgi:serine/threonine protein kinase